MDIFDKKIVLVTGAGKGTGRRVAETFAAHGATVAINDVSPVNLDETMAHIMASGGQVKTYVEDIAKKMPIQGLLNSVLDDFGRIDILVNCAEVEPQKTVLEMDDWDWQRTMEALSALAAYELIEYNVRVHHIQPDETGDVTESILELCTA
jgi:NAD(P)-dependent dehydrogenase (short-subunit alcohol dehydrogenase family)